MRAALVALFLSIICASAGIIIGVVTKTGMGLKLASSLIDLSGGVLLPSLFFTMITAIVLGMGVPTTANYVITSTVAAPALLQIGIPALAAHMFVFYFGIIADVTPPVALAAFAGAGISGGNALRTGINASKLAIAAFIIPYMFVMSPELLLQGGDISITIVALVTAIIGMIALSASLIGYFVDYMKKPERLILFMGGLLMVNPGVTTDIIGIALIITVIFLQKRHKRKTL